jgi:ribosomal protein L9
MRFVMGLAPIDPAAVDKVNIDAAIDRYSFLMNNDPRMMRTDQEVAQIRAQRAQEQQQQKAMQAAEAAPKLTQAATDLSQIPVGQGQNAFERMMQQAPQGGMQ